MFTLILSGNFTAKEEFLEVFVKDHKIPTYNIYKFGDGLKISEAREIKKNLALKSSDNRLIIVGENPSAEAQNALLKTIEELPEDTFFIFMSEALLLPTIFSRSQVVNLGEVDLSNLTILNFELNNSSASDTIVMVDELLSKGDKDLYATLILSLRKKILALAKLGHSKDTKRGIATYRKLLKYLVLTKTNNLNSRIAMERAFLELL
ncbi:MAG TPA: hypothetical protein VHE53_02380 [Patescibacteria group bacterium]|nr:hypothetical protein [Patescibacteria group bacterium]